jgi:hypothetical protein
MESVKYEWKSNRTRLIEITKGNPMQVPTQNTIELSWVKNTTLEKFKRDYHNPTAEELKRAEDAMKDKANKMDAEGKTTKQQSEKALTIANESMSKWKVEEVPNLGTYSVFVNSGIMGVTSRELMVFYRGLMFSLDVNLSDDVSYNDKKAIETAKMIIDQKLK